MARKTDKDLADTVRAAVRDFNHASHELAKRGVKVNVDLEFEADKQPHLGERRCSLMCVEVLMRL